MASNTKLRYRIAGLLLLLAAGLAVMAFRIESKQYLIPIPSNQHVTQRYVRMWFDAADDLVGAYWQGSTLVVERWSGTNPAAKWRFDLSGPGSGKDGEKSLWAMASDSSRLAWISGSTLHSQQAGGASKPVQVELGRKALALSALTNGSVAVVFDDLSVGRWDPASGRALGEWRAPLQSAERAAAEGDYVAFSSAEEGKLTVFAFQGRQWIQAQQSLSPELPERIVLPTPSVAGTMMQGRLRVGGVTRAGPGPIRSVAAHLYDVLAAGDFDGIYVLPPDGEFYRLADAAPGSLVAAGETHFAVGGSGGTTLLGIGSENRLTQSGRKSSYMALLFVALAAALAIGPLLLGAVVFSANLITRHPKSLGLAANTLGTPPADLITACASGRTMLWAGAGLSAQSGFPVRAKFIATLIQMAAVEFDDLPLKKLRALCESRKTEAALNELVLAMAAHRGEILSEFIGIFARFSPPSRSHELLGRLNLHSAVTTNYDVLLERTCDVWASNVRHLGEDVLSGRFLLKLYGSLSDAPSALLSRAEFLAALDRPNVEMLRQVFAMQPMLFVGCSLEALLADLATMHMPEGTGEIRFAIAGVSGNWEKPAEELLRRYGIQTLACSEEQIGQELPRFLQLMQTGSSQNQAAAASR